MSEMIERVALAISGGDDAASILEIHRHRARLAIEAMREPTDEMVKEGGVAVWESNSRNTGKMSDWPAIDAKAGYQAMIDEALK